MNKANLINVVLIDDNLADNYIHRRVVEKSGVGRVLSDFTMAEEALDWLRCQTETVHVIFLNINMPAMDGFGFLEQYQSLNEANQAECVVIFLTSSLNERDKTRAEEFGVDYQYKPLTSERFLEFLRQKGLLEG